MSSQPLPGVVENAGFIPWLTLLRGAYFLLTLRGVAPQWANQLKEDDMELTARKIVAIARSYGLRPSAMKWDALRAREYDGQLALNTFTGQVSVNWGTNERGYYVASKLFDGYCSETARVQWCDAQAARDFEECAY